MQYPNARPTLKPLSGILVGCDPAVAQAQDDQILLNAISRVE